jgi:hypothetical protein
MIATFVRLRHLSAALQVSVVPALPWAHGHRVNNQSHGVRVKAHPEDLSRQIVQPPRLDDHQ